MGYDRDGNSATNIIGSSGFEHVFLGESKNGKISGFHNWIYWGYEEQAGNLNYFGKLDQIDFGQVSEISVGKGFFVILI